MELPTRKPLRLTEYDYGQNGVYFVTICTKGRAHLFGAIENGEMIYTNAGIIACKEIITTNSKRNDHGIIVEKYTVMPNHVHMIIAIHVGSRLAVTAPHNHFSHPTKNSLASIVGGYKSAVTKRINATWTADMASHVPTSVWQPRYYEHIIRTDQSYQEIWNYIDTNPQKWTDDCYYISPVTSPPPQQ